LSWRVSVVLRHVGLVVVPGLRALHENVGIGPEPAGIVQGADAKPDDVGASRDLHVERCATVAAETPDDVVAAVGLCDISPWGSLEDAESSAGDAGGGDVRGTALALAVATMAAQGEDGLAHRFVTDRSAEAAAGSGFGHGWSPVGERNWRPTAAAGTLGTAASEPILLYA